MKNNNKIIAIASDHAGFELKTKLKKQINLEDLGSESAESVDYPDFALRMSEYLKDKPDAFGILVCGSGIGISIAANRFNHIRAALCKSEEDAKLARAHNNANVIVLSGRHTELGNATAILQTFLNTEFEGGRHQRRVNKLSEANMFQKNLANADNEVFSAIHEELERQKYNIELIASENIVSQAVLDAQGSIMTNKYAEGYSGRRYYGGCEYVDKVEDLAIERVKKLFGVKFANVQPHSGSQANQAVYAALLQPGDSILGMSLDSGGHLTHGAKVNMSGKWFNAHLYNVDQTTGLINYDEVKKLANEHKPKLIIAGASAYTRIIDFKKFREIANEVGALLLVDMAHYAGLIATGNYPSPVGYADVMTSTTHKTLRGPRGGIILTDNEEIAKKINSAIFPGIQGGPLMHVIAAKAVAFKEALEPAFKEYSKNVVENARVLASTLVDRGYKIFTGGTDCHMMLVDLRPQKLTGKAAEKSLENARLTCNKNSIPFDTEKPMITSGLRLGTPAGTTRGFGKEEFKLIGNLIADVLDGLQIDPENNSAAEDKVKSQVIELCNKFPIY